jgi:hypothetical protein
MEKMAINGKSSGTGLPLNWNRTPAQQEPDSRSTGTGLLLNRTGLPLNRNRTPAQQEPYSCSTGNGLPLNRNRSASNTSDRERGAASQEMDGSGDGSDSGTRCGKMSNRSQKGGGVQRPAEVATRGRTATGSKDGTSNNGGGSGQEAPRYTLGSTGAWLLLRPIWRGAAAGEAMVAATSRRCHTNLSRSSSGEWELLDAPSILHPKMYLMSAYSCIEL